MTDRLIRRHSRSTVAAHALLAATMLALAATGLMIDANASSWFVAALGGHDRLVSWHRWIGIAATAALAATVVIAPGNTMRLVRHAARFRRADAAWVRSALRAVVRPRVFRLGFHDGHFDPVQRVVFIVMGASLFLLAATGVAISVAPRDMAALVGVSIRVHNTAGWVFIAAALVHAVAGSGVLPTHRGAARAMIDGQVRTDTAARLWPAWAERRNPPAPR